MKRSILGALIVLASFTASAAAQDFKQYRTTTLDALVDEWNRKTSKEGPGYSFSRPEKLKLIVKLGQAPKPCETDPLRLVLRTMGFEKVLEQVKVSQCIGLVSDGGRAMPAYVQDVLVDGLNADAKVGRSIEAYVDFLAFEVNADRSRNRAILMLNRFEPL
ncbi:hypothetical protein FBZ93_103158 [Bradyrhizobium macuxiense]|uniref:Uncharacterized protein n=2 Tax=Bradyrhizobium macuxiense TaxID=1755647 RepID=A0A560MC12_9BRAD|nr:hypothetical protein FBZ93_103158 [Bradyrhizobium macuxiense]